jgi:chromosome segregation ATPase
MTVAWNKIVIDNFIITRYSQPGGNYTTTLTSQTAPPATTPQAKQQAAQRAAQATDLMRKCRIEDNTLRQKAAKARQAEKNQERKLEDLNTKLQENNKIQAVTQQNLKSQAELVEQQNKANAALQAAVNNQTNAITNLTVQNEQLSNKLVTITRTNEELSEAQTKHTMRIAELEKTIDELTKQVQAIPTLQRTVDLLVTELREQRAQLTEILKLLSI